MAPVLEKAAGFAAIEAGVTMLRGIVDEYEVRLGPEGVTASIDGRGYAARLLDNESRPVTYQDATLAEIVRCHVTAYGITCAETADLRAEQRIRWRRDAAEWKALDAFCQTYGGFSPRFTRDGKLLAGLPHLRDAAYRWGRRIPVLSCSLREDHYGVLTEALVIDKTRNRSYSVKDPGSTASASVSTP